MNKVGIVSTKLGKEILGFGDARNEMICFVLRHRAGVSGNESQEFMSRRRQELAELCPDRLQEGIYWVVYVR